MDPSGLSLSDPFMNLPDEMLLQICEEMDIGTLLNTAEASSRVYQVCSEVIKKRRKDYQRAKHLLRVLSEAKDRDFYWLPVQKVKAPSELLLYKTNLIYGGLQI